MEPTLTEGTGYGVILGLGLFFAGMMFGVTYFQNKYSKHKTTQADEFTTASRNIPIGLMVVSIVSSWTWSLTLLQSATNSYNQGISGSWWYAVGGIIQVSVFSIVAAKIKQNANLVTTFPEMAYFRFGTWGHLSFLFCGLVCNTVVSACILLGGGTVFHAVTNMNIYAAYFLIPFVCAVYVVFGGLRATFISDASHTFILLVFLIIFAFLVYGGGSNVIGSPGKMYDMLTELAHEEPLSGAYHGSYLTFQSLDGGINSFISIFTGFGLVALDQAYFSRSVASNASTTSKAYFLGAIGWFIIPTSMGLILGLAARACSTLPDWVPLTDNEVSAGLSAVAAATYLFGKAGSTMILLMVFLSVISSFSGELIATATLISYDLYKKYFNRNATPKQVLLVSQFAVFFWAIFASVVAVIFNKIGITMGWLFYFLGTSTCSVVIPMGLTFTWKKMNTMGAVIGSLGGMACALTAWLVCCKVYMGSINVDNLSNRWVSFCGDMSALVMGGLLCIIFSLIKPADFDWNLTRNRTILKEHVESSDEENSPVEIEQDKVNNIVKEKNSNDGTDEITYEDKDDLPSVETIAIDELEKQFRQYIVYCIILAVIIAILIPVPMSATNYVFSKKFFTFAVAFMFIWLFWTFAACIIWPIYESRQLIWGLLTNKHEPSD